MASLLLKQERFFHMQDSRRSKRRVILLLLRHDDINGIAGFSRVRQESVMSRRSEIFGLIDNVSSICQLQNPETSFLVTSRPYALEQFIKLL